MRRMWHAYMLDDYIQYKRKEVKMDIIALLLKYNAALLILPITSHTIRVKLYNADYCIASYFDADYFAAHREDLIQIIASKFDNEIGTIK